VTTFHESFVSAATVVFLLLALIWNKKDWTNLAFKIVFILLTVWGGVLLMQAHKLIVRVPA